MQGAAVRRREERRGRVRGGGEGAAQHGGGGGGGFWDYFFPDSEGPNPMKGVKIKSSGMGDDARERGVGGGSRVAAAVPSRGVQAVVGGEGAAVGRRRRRDVGGDDIEARGGSKGGEESLWRRVFGRGGVDGGVERRAVEHARAERAKEEEEDEYRQEQRAWQRRHQEDEEQQQQQQLGVQHHRAKPHPLPGGGGILGALGITFGDSEMPLQKQVVRPASSSSSSMARRGRGGITGWQSTDTAEEKSTGSSIKRRRSKLPGIRLWGFGDSADVDDAAKANARRLQHDIKDGDRTKGPVWDPQGGYELSY